MAFMNQERKAQIAAELKKVMPKDWKYSLSVKHHSTIVLTISAAPVDLMAAYNEQVGKRYNERYPGEYKPETHAQVNEYHLDSQFSGELLAIFERIKGALNVGNHDHSDLQTDYFDVGWYVDINIGRWDKPFTVCAPCAPSNKPEVKPITQTLAEPSKTEPKVIAFPQSDLAHCWRMPMGTC